MAFITNYYINGSNGIHLDLLTTSSIRDGVATPVKLVGTAGQEFVYAATGSILDASEMGTGNDVLYLTGESTVYDRTKDEYDIHTLRRTENLAPGQEEVIMARSLPEQDRLYFRDGYVELDSSGAGFEKLYPLGAQDPHPGALWNPNIDYQALRANLSADEFINAVVTDNQISFAFIMSYLNNQVTMAAISDNTFTPIHRITIRDKQHADNLTADIDTTTQTASLNDPVTLKYGLTNFAFPYTEFDNVKHAGNTFYGTSGDDHVTGGDANEIFYGAEGDDVLEGGSGSDMAVYGGRRADFAILERTGEFHLSDQAGQAGNDTLKNIETIRFDDSSINLKIGDHAKEISAGSLQMLQELYVAFFNRVPDADGLNYWISQIKDGRHIDAIADSFYSAAIQHTALTGYAETTSHADFIKTIYKNVLGRFGNTAPTAEEYGYWAGELANGHATRGSVVRDMLVSAHTFKGDATWGWVSDLLDNKNQVAHFFAVQNGLNYPTPDDSIVLGMAIAAAVTPTDTSAAIALIGVSDAGFSLA